MVSFSLNKTCMQLYKQSKSGRMVIVLACMLVSIAFVGACPARATELPFSVGEKLTFILKWGFIPAGEAVLEVLPPKKVNGEDANHFVLTARSNSFVDHFYKVRDRIESFTDADMTRSVHYIKKQREGSTDKDIVVTFDWAANTARYSNYGELIDPIPLLPGTFDPLGAFFYTRLVAGASVDEVSRPVTDGKKNVIGRARIVKKEQITVPAGTFDTYKLEPVMKDVGGVFRKSKNAKLHVWVTADSRRMLVKVKSKVIVGSFVGVLVSVPAKNNTPHAAEQ
jgi:hypothetical protein